MRLRVKTDTSTPDECSGPGRSRRGCRPNTRRGGRSEGRRQRGCRQLGGCASAMTVGFSLLARTASAINATRTRATRRGRRLRSGHVLRSFPAMERAARPIRVRLELAGAALQATSMSFGTVCAPGQRYHPAVIAQAAATLAEMFPAGSGWPSAAARRSTRRHGRRMAVEDRTAHAATRERGHRARAWAGETVTTRGPVTVVDAKLYTRPTRPPLLLGAALSAETAFWLGGWRTVLSRLRVRVTPCGMSSTRSAKAAAKASRSFCKWRSRSLARTARPSRSRTTNGANASSRPASWRTSRRRKTSIAHARPPIEARCSAASARRQTSNATLPGLYDDLTLGYERVYLHNVAPAEQERFIAACGERLLPGLRRAAGASLEKRA